MERPVGLTKCQPFQGGTSTLAQKQRVMCILITEGGWSCHFSPNWSPCFPAVYSPHGSQLAFSILSQNSPVAPHPISVEAEVLPSEALRGLAPPSSLSAQLPLPSPHSLHPGPAGLLTIPATHPALGFAQAVPSAYNTFLQMPAWLPPSPPSSLCSGVIFSMRPTLTILFKIAAPDGQKAHEQMLNITNYQRNANQNYSEV